MQWKMHGRINKPKNAGLTYISKPITKETNMSKEDPKEQAGKEAYGNVIMEDMPIPDCKHECGYNEIKNGECECYNREMDKLEEQAPC